MYCTECGQKLSGDAWFCTECGSFQSEPVVKSESSELVTGSADTSAPQPITAALLAEGLMVGCTQCGHKLSRDAWFCTECDSFQNEPAPTFKSPDLDAVSAETAIQQPIPVADLPADLPQRSPTGMTSGWQWLVSIVSRSLATID
jgi:hypothetical protein